MGGVYVDTSRSVVCRSPSPRPKRRRARTIAAVEQRGFPIAPLLSRIKKRTGNELLTAVPSLPDCWIYVSREFLNEYGPLQIEKSRRRLCEMVAMHASGDALGELLRRGEVRVVTVSRARYNPRFRGRLLVDPKAVELLLVHAALCVAASVPFDDFDIDAGPSSDVGGSVASPRRHVVVDGRDRRSIGMISSLDLITTLAHARR